MSHPVFAVKSDLQISGAAARERYGPRTTGGVAPMAQFRQDTGRRGTPSFRALGFKTYTAYLRSHHWAEVKRRYRESDRPQRCVCGARADDLHHLTYARIGSEELTDLIALCRGCHRKTHRKRDDPDWERAYRHRDGASESAAVAADAGEWDT